MAELNEFLAVIVLYNCVLEDSITFTTLTSSLKEANKSLDLLIYDNSKTPQNFKTYNEWHITYIHNPLNPGVGAAYNKGFEQALISNKKWLFLLDQDTHFPPQTIKSILFNVTDHNLIRLFAPILKHENTFISPSIFRLNRGFSPSVILPGISRIKGKSPINSGLVVAVSLYQQVGGYNEKIKLDFSDFYFIKKVSKVINEFVIMDIVCMHNLSSGDLSSTLSNGVLCRYKTYCEGAKHFANNLTDYIILTNVTLLRGFNLCIKYKTFRFLPIFIRNFILGYKI